MIKINNINQIDTFNEDGDAVLYINSIENYKAFYEQIISDESIASTINKASWRIDYRKGITSIANEYVKRMDSQSHCIVLKVKKIDEGILRFVFSLYTNSSMPAYSLFANSYSVNLI